VTENEECLALSFLARVRGCDVVTRPVGVGAPSVGPPGGTRSGCPSGSSVLPCFTVHDSSVVTPCLSYPVSDDAVVMQSRWGGVRWRFVIRQGGVNLIVLYVYVARYMDVHATNQCSGHPFHSIPSLQLSATGDDDGKRSIDVDVDVVVSG